MCGGGGDCFAKEETSELSSQGSPWAEGGPCTDPVGLGMWDLCDINPHSNPRKWVLALCTGEETQTEEG